MQTINGMFEAVQNGTIEIFNKIANIGASIQSEVEYFTFLNSSIKIYDGKYNILRITPRTKAVVIMLHGMNSSSGQFQLHMNEIDKYNFEHDVVISMYIPEIMNKGFVKLETAGEDIFSKIDPHIETIMNSNIPLFFIGISNGGRVALYLFSKIIEKYNYDNMFITSLGSPNKGTNTADLLLKSKLYVFSAYKNEDVLEELKLNSEMATNLFAKCESYPNFRTNTLFYFAKYDAMVNGKEYNNEAIYDNIKIICDVGHNGLIPKCYKEQINWCIEKMNDCDDLL